MISEISLDQELNHRVDRLEIDHPLWHGLKVVPVPSKWDLYGQITSLFFKQVPIGDRFYADPSNQRFFHLWELYQKSGKTVERFQIDVLKETDLNVPVETKIAAALSLSDVETLEDSQLVIQKIWHDTTDEIAVIFTQSTKPLEEGGFSVISQVSGLLINPLEKKIDKMVYVLKTPKDEEAKGHLTKGMEVLKKIWGPGLVKPSMKILVRNGQGKLEEEWAMVPYTADFRKWARINQNDQLKIVQAFFTGFTGLKALQDRLVVHLDLKPPNLLVMEDKEDIRIDINDFDACFALPTQLDPQSITEFKKDLTDFTLIRTTYYSRSAETRQLRKHLNEMKGLLEKEELPTQAFSEQLSHAALLLKQIQIYEWGWCLLTALTNTSPSHLVPTSSKDRDVQEEKIEAFLSTIKEEELRNILHQALDPNPDKRPSLETFRTAIGEFIERKEAAIIPDHERDFTVTIPITSLLGKSARG